jgi:hypothetical protein
VATPDPKTKWTHRVERRPSYAGTLNGDGNDISFSTMRPCRPLRFSGQFITSEPILGQYVGFPTDNSKVAAFEASLGRPLDYTLAFTDANNIQSNIFALQSDTTRRMVISQCLIAPGWDMAATAAGSHDSDYDNASFFLSAYADRVVSIRIGWEMNFPNGYPWSIGGSGVNVTKANYIACFRRLVDFFRQRMPDVPIDWCPGFDQEAETWYPGDDYVDIIGSDIYLKQAFYSDNFNNVYSAISGLRWLDKFSSSHGKMISVPEWSGDYNSGVLINGMAKWLRRPRANPVIYHSYWNSTDSFNGLLTNYPNAAAAYYANFGDPGNMYVGAP